MDTSSKPDHVSLKVAGDHRWVHVYPRDHTVRLDGQALEVLDASGAVVKRYPVGGWHGYGTSIGDCVGHDSQPCEVCGTGPEPE